MQAVKAAVDYIEPKEDLQGPKLVKDYAAEKIDLVRNRDVINKLRFRGSLVEPMIK